MCGIICEICYTIIVTPRNETTLQRIAKRGPDCTHHTEYVVRDEIKAYFSGSVLWMQGLQITLQPVENDHGILLYNGDIFNERWSKCVSDTQIIMDKLTKSMINLSEDELLYELKTLKGPFCIVYFHKQTCNLYFMRDRIGRNSLLFHLKQNYLIISSILDRTYECIEVPATYIHKLNIESKNITLYPWADGPTEKYSLNDWLTSQQNQQSLADDKLTYICEETYDLDDDTNVVDYIQITAQDNKCRQIILHKLMKHETLRNTVNKTSDLLEKSVKIRLETQPKKCQGCLRSNVEHCDHSTVGILFSGGLDCTILAVLADKYTPKMQSIDLINVAFKRDNNITSYDVPDRVTGRQSHEELKKLCPTRKWVFREVNVPKEELEDYQKSTIADLVHPRQTILDESLGTAFWFAARGKDEFSTSPSRVLLLGSGADELFGGYIRHRNAYKRQGWPGLNRELDLDWKRISFRNLARDNRVICDHGRQPRLPYLDENFTNFVLGLKPWLKCFPSDTLGPGIGDKLMLRMVALNLGLSEVVTFPKRALQFGSRIANKKEKGSDISLKFQRNSTSLR